MEQQQAGTFQWSISLRSSGEQYSVSCDDFEKFTLAIGQVRNLLKEEALAAAASMPMPDSKTHEAPLPSDLADTSVHTCPIHKDSDGHAIVMRLRTSKSGQQWYDHRWKEDDVWFQCNGKETRKSS